MTRQHTTLGTRCSPSCRQTRVWRRRSIRKSSHTPKLKSTEKKGCDAFAYPLSTWKGLPLRLAGVRVASLSRSYCCYFSPAVINFKSPARGTRHATYRQRERGANRRNRLFERCRCAAGGGAGTPRFSRGFACFPTCPLESLSACQQSLRRRGGLDDGEEGPRQQQTRKAFGAVGALLSASRGALAGWAGSRRLGAKARDFRVFAAFAFPFSIIFIRLRGGVGRAPGGGGPARPGPRPSRPPRGTCGFKTQLQARFVLVLRD